MMDTDTEPGCSALVIHDEAREVFTATIIATGATFESAETREVAAWLYAAGVQPGRVSMPRERVPSFGDRITLNATLRALWQSCSFQIR